MTSDGRQKPRSEYNSGERKKKKQAFCVLCKRNVKDAGRQRNQLPENKTGALDLEDG